MANHPNKRVRARRDKAMELTRQALKLPGAMPGQFGPRPVQGSVPRKRSTPPPLPEVTEDRQRDGSMAEGL